MGTPTQQLPQPNILPTISIHNKIGTHAESHTHADKTNQKHNWTAHTYITSLENKQSVYQTQTTQTQIT